MATRKKPVMTAAEYQQHLDSRQRDPYLPTRNLPEGYVPTSKLERDGTAWWTGTALESKCKSQLSFVGMTNLPGTIQVHCHRCGSSNRFLPNREWRDWAHVCRQCRADPTYVNPRRQGRGSTAVRGHHYANSDLTWVCYHIDPATFAPSGKQVVQCQCGTLFLARSNNIYAGATKSCGCLANRKPHPVSDSELADSLYYTLETMGVTPVTGSSGDLLVQLKEVRDAPKPDRGNG